MTDLLARMRKDAVEIFNAGVQAVAADTAVKQHCRRRGDTLFIDNHPYYLDDYRHIHIIGAGKATAAMAGEMERILTDRPLDGVIVVKYGHNMPLKHIETVEAGHPVPDENGVAGADRILRIAEKATADDLIICLLSGGASALLPAPVKGVSLADKQRMTRRLLACGADIHDINAMRKHLSRIKGGLLAAAAAPATLVSLMLSDVVGDDPDVIASGPTVPDRSTFDDCPRIIRKYGIADRLPSAVRLHLESGGNGKIPETPKPGHPAFSKTGHVIIGGNMTALAAAAEKSERLGYHPLILSSMIEGDTGQAAGVHAAIVKQIIKTGHPVPAPACILSGGETTVTLKGDGLGGRNQEFALWAAKEIAGPVPAVILSGGTDGTDGPTDAAGAVADNTTISRAAAMGLDANLFLDENDTYRFFKKLGDLINTGPTRTNVMDVRIMLVG